MAAGRNPRSIMPSRTSATAAAFFLSHSGPIGPPSLVSAMCQEWSARTRSPSIPAAIST